MSSDFSTILKSFCGFNRSPHRADVELEYRTRSGVVRGNAMESTVPTAIQVAREFFALAQKDGDPQFTTWKLQKLLYYAQAWSLHHRGCSLYRETVKAWADGPVVPAVYKRLQGKYGLRPDDPEVAEALAKPSDLDHESRMLVFAIWQLYKSKTGDELSEKTHTHYAYQHARARAHLFNNSPAIRPEHMRAEIAAFCETARRRADASLRGLGDDPTSKRVSA